MAKRLKTLNLCDDSVDRLKRSPRGQSAYARECILGYDRRRQQVWDLQRELDERNSLLDMNRENFAILVTALLDAWGDGWTIQDMLAHLTGMSAHEMHRLHGDGHLKSAIRSALTHRAMHGGGSPA